jgi:hypothetical protein
MDNERDVRGVDALHEVRKFLLLPAVVRHVSNQGEVEAGAVHFLYSLAGCTAAEQENKGGQNGFHGDSSQAAGPADDPCIEVQRGEKVLKKALTFG